MSASMLRAASCLPCCCHNRAKLAVARLGLRYYLTERFVMSGDYSLYTAFISDQRSTEYKAWTLGLSFFF